MCSSELATLGDGYASLTALRNVEDFHMWELACALGPGRVGPPQVMELTVALARGELPTGEGGCLMPLLAFIGRGYSAEAGKGAGESDSKARATAYSATWRCF